ncbi:MAG: peptidylprolyl isomerase, partial [Flavobacteriaceae bacterium]
MKYTCAIITFLLISISLSSCKSSKYAELSDGIYADIQTNRGDIIVKLEHEKTPVTVANFIALAEGTNPFVSEEYKDKKYYDGVVFHRVIQDFMIQGGDPTATGSGNPGYRFKDEFNDSLTHYKAGILSMANSGPKTNGSQFFITHKETPFLDGRHTVFGEVVLGMEIVDSIARVKTTQEPNKKNRPVVDVVMNTIEIVRKGKVAKDFNAVQILTEYFDEEAEQQAILEKIKIDFIAEIAGQRDSAEELPSGLRFQVVKSGEGLKPKLGDTIMVNYAGWLAESGLLFDTNEKAIAEKFGDLDKISRIHPNGFIPIPMTYSPDAPLIPGFKEGLLRMGVGDKLRLFLPPHLGLGP